MIDKRKRVGLRDIECGSKHLLPPSLEGSGNSISPQDLLLKQQRESYMALKNITDREVLAQCNSHDWGNYHNDVAYAMLYVLCSRAYKNFVLRNDSVVDEYNAHLVNYNESIEHFALFGSFIEIDHEAGFDYGITTIDAHNDNNFSFTIEKVDIVDNEHHVKILLHDKRNFKNYIWNFVYDVSNYTRDYPFYSLVNSSVIIDTQNNTVADWDDFLL